MGSPVYPIVANLYMRYFEQKAPRTATHPLEWHCYVDDTFVIQQQDHKQDFLKHINSVDLFINFTVKGKKDDGVIHFLDATVKPEPDGALSITV